MKKYLFFMSVILCSITFAQQTGKIEGYIRSANQNPLPGIVIKVNDVAKTTSDKDGKFSFQQEVGDFKLNLSNGKDEMITSTVHVYPNETTYLNLTFNKGLIELEEISVMAENNLFKNSVQYAIAENKNISGGNNVIDLKNQRNRRSYTLKDAIKDQPGVMIQEFFGGNDQPRLNIRGSGIQSNPQRRGINLLQDGVPYNFADGSYIIGVLDPQSANYIEIFRGANALEYGAANLGGALNMVSKTGYNTSPFHLKAEGGSFDMYNIQVESGLIMGKSDLYASVVKNHSNGFRRYNGSNRLGANFNFGYKINPNLETRFYTQYTDMNFEISGPLNKRMMKEDPKQISHGVAPKQKSIGPNVARDLPKRESKVFRAANKTIYKFNNKSFLIADLYYQYADDAFYYPIVSGVKAGIHNDYGLNVKYNLKSGNNDFKAGLRTSFGTTHQKYFANLKGKKGKKFADNDLIARNITLFLSDKYDFSSKWSGIVSLQTAFNHRQIKDLFKDKKNRPAFSYKKKGYTNFSAENVTLNKDYVGVNPRIGLLYEPKENTQYFFNASKSYEPPTFDELFFNAGGNPNAGPNKVGTKDLKAQSAYTLEIGSRSKWKFMAWNISLYRSWVKNEILTTTELFGITGVTRNSPDNTIHQGVELGLNLDFIKNQSNNLGLLLVYNYSDFYFEKGIYKGKQIAGIPKNYISGNLNFSNKSGIYFNLNMEGMPQKTYTDHQNTVYQDPFTLFGTRLGYDKKHWSVFVEVKNIFNENYASSYLIRDVVTNPPIPIIGPEDVTTFIPGSGRSFIIGFNYNL